jgi:ribosomal protein L14
MLDNNNDYSINNKKEMIGNRIAGVVGAELRAKGWGKICSIAPRVVFAPFAFQL